MTADATLDTLFAAAVAARENAHAPYSRFHVGAAVLSESGTIYAGCNVEVASFPEGWCAETTAIGKLVSAGEKQVRAVVVVAAGERLTTPCGGCRQRLAELAAANTPVHVGSPAGIRRTFTVGELLPAGFELDDQP
jgi:cytidine deaminase